MLCIELTRNGKRLATAGMPGKGVLTTIFTRVVSDVGGPIEQRDFSLDGLDTSTDRNRSLHWVGGPVVVGDEFTVRFVERDTADPPKYASLGKKATEAELRRSWKQERRNLEAGLRKLRTLLRASKPAKPKRKPKKTR